MFGGEVGVHCLWHAFSGFAHGEALVVGLNLGHRVGILVVSGVTDGRFFSTQWVLCEVFHHPRVLRVITITLVNVHAVGVQYVV